MHCAGYEGKVVFLDADVVFWRCYVVVATTDEIHGGDVARSFRCLLCYFTMMKLSRPCVVEEGGATWGSLYAGRSELFPWCLIAAPQPQNPPWLALVQLPVNLRVIERK